MYKLTILAVAMWALFSLSPVAEARVSVRGYFRQNGTYVMPHYRSNPDIYRWNNWSYYGNMNPYTGKIGYIR